MHLPMEWRHYNWKDSFTTRIYSIFFLWTLVLLKTIFGDMMTKKLNTTQHCQKKKKHKIKDREKQNNEFKQ